MIKRRYIAAGASSLVAVAIGIASAAAAPSSTNSKAIPRSVLKADRLQVVSQVLNTSTANVQAAEKNHTLKNLISQAGLTKQTFRQKVKADLISDLQSQGYSQQQINAALKHHHKHHKKA